MCLATKGRSSALSAYYPSYYVGETHGQITAQLTVGQSDRTHLFALSQVTVLSTVSNIAGRREFEHTGTLEHLET
jgi:hypothetical protein